MYLGQEPCKKLPPVGGCACADGIQNYGDSKLICLPSCKKHRLQLVVIRHAGVEEEPGGDGGDFGNLPGIVRTDGSGAGSQNHVHNIIDGHGIGDGVNQRTFRSDIGKNRCRQSVHCRIGKGHKKTSHEKREGAHGNSCYAEISEKLPSAGITRFKL